MSKTTFCVVLMLLSVFLGYILGLFHQAAQAKHRESDAAILESNTMNWEEIND